MQCIEHFQELILVCNCFLQAEKYGNVNLVLPKTDKYVGVPPIEEWKLSDDADYVYYCSNETVGGKDIAFDL